MRQAPELFVVDDETLVAQRGLHPAIALGLEVVGDLCHSLDEHGVVEAYNWTVVEGRACNPHQTASLVRRDATRPVSTDVVALLGRRPCFMAPYRNSIWGQSSGAKGLASAMFRRELAVNSRGPLSVAQHSSARSSLDR